MAATAYGDVQLRLATPDDAPAMDGVMVAAGETPTPGVNISYLGQLTRHGHTWIAVRGDEVVAFGAAVDSGRSRHLADLHVKPDQQARGIGGRLLAAAMGDAFPRSTFASSDPRAVPLYIRAGMDLQWPNLYFEGNPQTLPDAPAGYGLDMVSLAEMARLEHQWRGSDRGRELPFWADALDCRPFVVSVRGAPVATGLSRRRIAGTNHWIDHATAAPGADPVPALMTALRLAGGDATLSGASVAGPSPLSRKLLDAGFRLVDRDVFLASEPSLVDPHRELLNTGFL